MEEVEDGSHGTGFAGCSCDWPAWFLFALQQDLCGREQRCRSPKRGQTFTTVCVCACVCVFLIMGLSSL